MNNLSIDHFLRKRALDSAYHKKQLLKRYNVTNAHYQVYRTKIGDPQPFVLVTFESKNTTYQCLHFDQTMHPYVGLALAIPHLRK